LNEKRLAARRNGIKTVLVPKENEKDMPDILPRVKEGLNIVYIETIADALPWVFGKKM
jgi:ATP-dependent Lon protease